MQIRLYDGKDDEFEVVTIDDRIPCKLGSSEPVFARPNGNELWVILLEKVRAADDCALSGKASSRFHSPPICPH